MDQALRTCERGRNGIAGRGAEGAANRLGREKKIDKRDKTMRMSATVSIDGRREETKPNSMGSEEGERGGKGF